MKWSEEKWSEVKWIEVNSSVGKGERVGHYGEKFMWVGKKKVEKWRTGSKSRVKYEWEDIVETL